MSERLFCYYGDDFTGSTDALEALASNGVETVLFLQPPDDSMLAEFPGCQAIGIAGESRSRGPAWMSGQLPSIFRSLKAYGAPVCQYKVCSTFDSSPQYGSIGRALEIGSDVFRNPFVPIVVGAPHLQRFVLFGNLFAAGPGGIYRIDRHPGMRNHPVTPMQEGDLRLHLAGQTDRKIALLDILALRGVDPEGVLEGLLADHPDAVLFDGLDELTLQVTGRLVWTRRGAPQSFAIGSGGLTHALVQHWRREGKIVPQFTPPPASAADRLIVISGSCSPVTEGQIRWARNNGFEHLRVDAANLNLASTLSESLIALMAGRSLVIYTAMGLQDRGETPRGEELGSFLGTLLHKLLVQSGVRRALIAGGDTSTHAVRQLGIHALTFVALTAPGAPLCRCHSAEAALHGVEIVLKGGQVGPPHYFESVRKGRK
ncbi:MAG: four-carbon acid sugar kinase family protein [Bryobacteraceae bacterium]